VLVLGFGIGGKEGKGRWGLGEFGSLLPLDLPLEWLPAKLVGISNSIMKKSFIGKGELIWALRGIAK
jgi:hypothetical protein